ncbi:phytanoyl-CoA dioxygenase [Aureococcus anophagefferens]|nr:phytanoyl-CoA dioxygenase [Aureococcus anophagefferens]
MSFERDGFCVLRGWLPAAAVDALRGDLRRARAQLKITDAALEAADLNVDFMGRVRGAGAATPRGPSSGRRRAGAKRRRGAPTPLWFAVAAAPTREALEATLDRANAAPPGYRVVRGACAAARFPPDELPEVSCRVFRSPKGAFCLDGTKHPDALLTQSMARDDTLAALIRGAGVCGEGDGAAGVAEYAVLDDLDDARWAALGLPACPLEPARRRRSRQLFVSRGATTTQVHRDAYDNVYVCLRGERRLAHADHGPYVERSPGSVSAAADGALRRRVAFGEVALAPGDALRAGGHVARVPRPTTAA